MEYFKDSFFQTSSTTVDIVGQLMVAQLLESSDLNGPTMCAINEDHVWGYVPIPQGCQITFTMAEQMTPRGQCVKFLILERLHSWQVYQFYPAIEYRLCEL